MKGKRIFLPLVAVLATLGVAPGARADTVVLAAAADATLYEDGTGNLANGAGQYLIVGRTWDENGIDALLRRALLRFDLAAVPAGGTVQSVRLELTIDRVPPGATAATIDLHAVTAGWGEGPSNPPGPEGQGTRPQPGDATWVHAFYDTVNWTSPGGDFEPTPLASVPISSSPQAVTFDSTPALVAAVQAWVDDPAANFGWILRGDEQFLQNARRLLSRENTNPGVPTLTVEFTPPPPPPPPPPPEPEPEAPPPVPVPALTLPGLLLTAVLVLLAGLRMRAARPGAAPRRRLGRARTRR